MQRMSMKTLHEAWLARLPKGTRVRATFDLTSGDQRESFELTLATTCLVSVGEGEARKGTMHAGLVPALDAIGSSHPGWALDEQSLVVHQAPASAKRNEVKALLAPMIRETLSQAAA